MLRKIEKSIYGLKQAPHRWNICFNEKIQKFGFLINEDEQFLYIRSSGSVVVFLVLYVDDILLIGKDIPTLNSVEVWIWKSLIIKDMVEVVCMLCIKIYKDKSR